MTADKDPRIAEAQELTSLARRLLQALAEDAGAQRAGVPVHVNMVKAMGGLAFTLGLLVEAMPELSSTPRAVRTHADDFAKKLRSYVSMLRTATLAAGGITPLETFFGGNGLVQRGPCGRSSGECCSPCSSRRLSR